MMMILHFPSLSTSYVRKSENNKFYFPRKKKRKIDEKRV